MVFYSFRNNVVNCYIYENRTADGQRPQLLCRAYTALITLNLLRLDIQFCVDSEEKRIIVINNESYLRERINNRPLLFYFLDRVINVAYGII